MFLWSAPSVGIVCPLCSSDLYPPLVSSDLACFQSAPSAGIVYPTHPSASVVCTVRWTRLTHVLLCCPGLYRGSTLGLPTTAPSCPVPAPRRPDRPTTLPPYENVRMASSAAPEPELVLRRGRPPSAAAERGSSLVILSPFNEQEEWNKVYDIVASYGDGIMSEIDQELQSRRGEAEGCAGKKGGEQSPGDPVAARLVWEDRVWRCTVSSKQPG